MVYSRRCIFQILQYGIIASQLAGLKYLYDLQIYYPLALLWIHTFVALVTTWIATLVITSVRNQGYQCCRSRGAISAGVWAIGLEGTLEAICGLLEVLLNICVVQCLFHTRSITLPFLFYYFSDIVLHLLGVSYFRFRPSSPFRAILVLLGSILCVLPFVVSVLLAERKLEPKAIILLFVAALAYIAKKIIQGYLECTFPNSERKAQWSKASTLLVLLGITSIAIFLNVEGKILVSHGGFQKLVVSFPIAMIFPSILMGLFNSFEHTKACPEDTEFPKCTDYRVDYAFARAVIDLTLTFFSTAVLLLQTPTWAQVVSYGSATLIITGGSLLLGTLVPLKTIITSSNVRLEGNQDDDPEFEVVQKLLMNEDVDTSRNKRVRSGYDGSSLKLWIFCLALATSKPLLESGTTRDPLLDRISLTEPSNTSFNPSRSFDIVVSYYRENLENLGDFINDIKSVQSVTNLNPHVIIYAKDNTSDIDRIKSIGMADEVIMLPNEGREGGAYLHHMINRWEDLANHTLFIQAEPHNPGRVLARLRGYFDRYRTGMLDLGYRELPGCNCLTCIDEYGWHDDINFIPELMAQAHHIQCDENTKVALSYKGQFLVSAKRIRALRKSVYETINEKLVGEKRIKIGGDQDRPDAPIFGYTLERSWNILFQCADLTGTRDMCPGLTLTNVAFGDFQRSNPEDCGCLDT